MPNGELSYAHQGLYPDNVDQFAEKVDETDRKIVAKSAEILPKAIIKRFGGDPRNPLPFFDKKFTGKTKELAHSYIQRRMADILPLLANRAIFEMGNDGYPAQEKVEFFGKKASITFHFIPENENMRYFPTIKLDGEPFKFINRGAVMPCDDPAWLLVEGKLISFERAVEGIKLKPFLKKPFIEVPPRQWDVYFKRFVPQLIERYFVHSKCFGIRTLREQPRFFLQVKENGDTHFSFDFQVKYGDYSLRLLKEGYAKAFSEKTETGEYLFYKVKRDVYAEDEIRDFLKTIIPNPNSLTPWEYLEREDALVWLTEHAAQLQEREVKILQAGPSENINLRKPEIELESKESGDWFDIRAVVRIGEFAIPFFKFRKHILSGKREYHLPDGSICVLPEQWFSDYRHLLEVAEKKEESVLRIRKYQAPLMNFPSRNNGKEVSLMSILEGKNKAPVVAPPAGLKAQLRNYQQEGLNWLCFLRQNGIGGILADDMGLGKTLQTLALLLKEKEAGNEVPSLIVLPTSLLHNWQREAKKFTPDLKVYIHAGINRSKEPEVFEGQDLILTSYGLVRQDLTMLEQFPFHYLILDESQTIKNPASKTAKAVKKLKARHRLSLTGTPIENTVLDIWSQMAFLNPGLLGGEAFFKRFYVTPIEKQKDEARVAKLRRVIYPFILRRKKQQVEKELPPKVERLYYCDMEEKQAELYEEIRSQYRNYLLEWVSSGTYRKNKLNLLTGLQKLRQVAIHPKLVANGDYALKNSGKYLEVKRLLLEIISRDSKVLVFSQFVKMLHLLRDDLDKEGIAYNYLDGSTRDRQAQVDEFQKKETKKVFLISLKAGGVGLNLTAADYVFILDPWWNPAAENQAIDRSHRIGQEKTVFYYKFITEDTIEEKILGLQRRKAKLSDDLISIEDDIYKTMSEEDFVELLQ
jgi:superfamily II DNA or RNA helicase